jgi:hypothetical protein
MLRALAMLLGLMMQVSPPVPGQHSGAASNASDKRAQQHQGEEKTTGPAVSLPTPQLRDTSNGAQGVTSEDKEQSVKLTGIPPITIAGKQKTWLDHVFDWGPWVFSLSLVFVGIVGVRLAGRTLRTLDRQAELMKTQAAVMESQTALMQIQYRQWLVLADWTVDPTPKGDPVKKLRIRANLVNQTEFPMTISHGKIIFGDAFGDPNTTSQSPWEIASGSFLPPGTRQPIDVTIHLDQQDALEYTNGTFRIHVRGKFYHVDPLGDTLTTSLMGVLACGRWGTQYHPIVHMNPRREENQIHKAN